jgi:hypothetical protein
LNDALFDDKAAEQTENKLPDVVIFVEGNTQFGNAFDGGIAQLGERLHGMQEVSGSIPLTSTSNSICSVIRLLRAR